MDPYIGEIKLWAINFAPQGWALCNGALLNIQQNVALYSLLGTYYGGDGVKTFALPDLRGRVPVGIQPGGPAIGNKGGEETVALATAQVPPHTHSVNVYANAGNQTNGLGHHIAAAVLRTTPTGVNLYGASVPATNIALAAATVSSSGTAPAAGHNNIQPYLALNYYIATTGVYPPRP
jgi:microcystin-dependent protein